ncbi:hypothetical protein T12_11349, partial [Trichinella patagoniensis]
MRSKCAITKISTHFGHYRNGLHHQHRALSYSCVSLGWLNGVTQYWSRNLCGFAYHRTYIVNIVDLRWFSDTSHMLYCSCCWYCYSCVLPSVRLVSIFVEYYVS